MTFRLLHPLRISLVVAAIAMLPACGPKTEPPPAADAGGYHDATGPISEARLGVKIYPGAKIVTSGETDDVVSANLRTDAPVAEVVKFYEKELGATASTDPAMSMISAKKNKVEYAVTINADGGQTNVSIMGKK